MAIKVGINGFGRIGRNVMRTALGSKDFDFVAVNDITDTKTLAHLLKYDSTLGNLDHEVVTTDGGISVGGDQFKVFAERDPEKIDWESVGAEVVIESTGRFNTGAEASKHLRGTVKKVIITAPAKGEDVTVVLGVNEGDYKPAEHRVISNASCTTNCLAPVTKVLHETFGIVKAQMTTIHSYTNDQNILDLPHKDLRRARAAGLSMIPTTTGAAKAIGLVLPALAGKIDGYALRVPTPNVSVVDLTALLEKNATADEINDALRAAAAGPLKGILAVEDAPLVSIDYRQNPNSSIVDGPFTKVVDGNLVKVLAWYDNEWGYSCRVRDLVRYVVDQGI